MASLDLHLLLEKEEANPAQSAVLQILRGP
jgi:hypothetical protein